jgi:hypothetical protein
LRQQLVEYLIFKLAFLSKLDTFLPKLDTFLENAVERLWPNKAVKLYGEPSKALVALVGEQAGKSNMQWTS